MTPLDDITEALRDAIAGALADKQDELKAVAEAGGKAVKPTFLEDVGTLSDIISGFAGDILKIIPIIGDVADPLKLVEDAGGKFGSGVGIGYMLGYAGWQLIQPFVEPAQHAIADLAQTEIFDPATAADLQAKGIINEQYGRSEAAGGNLSGEHYDKLVDAAQDRPDLGTLTEMFRRQIIGADDFNLALNRHNIPGFWYPHLQTLARQILPVDQVALAVLRGNINHDTAVAVAGLTGWDPADLDVILLNTGEPPGAEQLMEAFRRGFIQEDTFNRGILQSRIRDEWIPTLMQLRYSPMSTADAVRAVVENYLNDDQGAAIAQQNGLLPEHWVPLRESWGRPLAHMEMAQLVHRGEATREQFDQAMRESDMKDKYIDQAFLIAERLPPERMIVSAIDHGVLNHDDGLALLLKLGYSPDNSELLIKLGVAQRTQAHKTLTKADILAMYTDALLPRQDAAARLKLLGYTDADATEELDLADFKAKASALKSTQRGIEAALKVHHLTQDQAIQQLTAAGVEATQAKNLTDEWLAQRGQVTRTLTEAQIISATGDKIITLDDARTRLKAYGLSDVDVEILLKIHGLVPIQ